MKTLRRTIHPTVKVLDASTGLVEYVASDESIDSYNEIVKADGAQFNRFEKNAPFVDSHNYESIDCLLGKVVDFRVSGRRVVETVQWAIDVPSNLLAQKGFQMTAAGYLKAVSIGFIPINYVTKWDSNQSAFREALEYLEVPSGTDVQAIYLAWEQMELSACVIGANPNAVAQIDKALKAGLLSDSDINQFSKISSDFALAFEQRGHRPRSYSFASEPKSLSGLQLLASIGEKASTNKIKTPNMTTNDQTFSQLERETRVAYKNLEQLRRTGTEPELERAVRRALAAGVQDKRAAFGNPIARYFERNPERRYFWNGIARAMAGTLRAGTVECEAVKAALGGTTDVVKYNKTRAAAGILANDPLGYALLESIPVLDEVWDLLLEYGQYKYLGLRKMIGPYTKYAQATGFPNAIFITPDNQGTTTIPVDTSLTGSAIAPRANTIAALIQASREWLADEKVDLSEVIFSKFVQAIAQRIDWGCFQGNGNDDQANGMQHGLFFDPTIATVQSQAGAGLVNQLTRLDFLNVIGAVNVAAFQRMDTLPPRWYISPFFVEQLLTLWDGTAHNYLLKTPAETGGEWLLLGFPVTWASQAPTANQPGAKVVAFGNPDAYLVALHEDFEITKSEGGAEFASNAVNFRGIAKGFSQIRQANGFATLTLS